MKKSFTKLKTTLVNEVLTLIHNNSFEMLTVRNLKFVSQVGRAGMILNEDEINNILNSLDQNTITITNNIIQLFYDKGFSILFSIKITLLRIIYLSVEYTSWKSMEKQYLLQMVNIICLI